MICFCVFLCPVFFNWINCFAKKNITQWIHQCLPCCGLWFESQAQYIRFFNLFLNCDVKRTKMNSNGTYFKSICEWTVAFWVFYEYSKLQIWPKFYFSIGSWMSLLFNPLRRQFFENSYDKENWVNLILSQIKQKHFHKIQEQNSF